MELDRDPERGEERRDSWGRLGGGETGGDTFIKPCFFTGIHGPWLGTGTSLQSHWHKEKMTL